MHTRPVPGMGQEEAVCVIGHRQKQRADFQFSVQSSAGIVQLCILAMQKAQSKGVKIDYADVKSCGRYKRYRIYRKDLEKAAKKHAPPALSVAELNGASEIRPSKLAPGPTQDQRFAVEETSGGHTVPPITNPFYHQPVGAREQPAQTRAPLERQKMPYRPPHLSDNRHRYPRRDSVVNDSGLDGMVHEQDGSESFGDEYRIRRDAGWSYPWPGELSGLRNIESHQGATDIPSHAPGAQDQEPSMETNWYYSPSDPFPKDIPTRSGFERRVMWGPHGRFEAWV